MTFISRRGLMAATLSGAAACVKGGPYFGNFRPPSQQNLTFANGIEPTTLDPALLTGNRADNVVAALRDSLTSLHPITSGPAAALATHYIIDNRDLRYTFFLRGHPSPRGVRLPNTDSLPNNFSRGHRAPDDRVAALWSDGTGVTAHDFVFAWRRLVDPSIAAPLGFYLSALANADDILAGKKPADRLGVRAIDDYTLQFDLDRPYPGLLDLLWQPFLAAVPSHIGLSNTGRRYLSSGPFEIREWRPRDRIVLTKNSHYWEAESVQLDEITVLPIASGATVMNVYRSGLADVVGRGLVPVVLIPALGRKRDFKTSPALSSTWFSLDVKRPPLDSVIFRYALCLATDRGAIASVLGGEHRPANGLVPPMRSYPSVRNLYASINGRSLDLLSFDPRAARALLAAEGLSAATLALAYPARPGSMEIAQVIQSQWRENLGIGLTLRIQEETVWEKNIIDGTYQDIIEDAWTAFYEDPYDFLGPFGPSHYVGTSWRDKQYEVNLEAAHTTSDPALRMQRLGACERQLLMAMPVIPVSFGLFTHLEAPYVVGLTHNPFGAASFKYVSIDTNWRAA